MRVGSGLVGLIGLSLCATTLSCARSGGGSATGASISMPSRTTRAGSRSTPAAAPSTAPVSSAAPVAPVASPPSAPAGTVLELPPAGQLYHGVYPGSTTGNEDDITPRNLTDYVTAAGRSVAWVYWSNNWGTAIDPPFSSRAFPLAQATWIRAQGAVPFVRLMLRSTMDASKPEPVFTLAAIASGQFDPDLAAWADAAAAFQTPVVVEFGTEVNGQWFSWNGTYNGGAGAGPQAFKAAYRHIVLLMRGRGATNLTWAFHVNATDDPAVSWNAFENYYPGDDVVDWVGLSAYGAQSPNDTGVAAFADQVDPAVARLQALAPSKPVFVFELGACDCAQITAAAWSQAALSSLLSGRWPAVRGFSWWNEAWTSGAATTDMRVQSVPGLATAFQASLAGSPAVCDHALIR